MKLLLPLLAILTLVVIADAMSQPSELDIDKEIKLLEERQEKKHRPTLRRRNQGNSRKPKDRKAANPVDGQKTGPNNVNQENGGSKKRQKVYLNFTEANRQITALIKTRYKKAGDMLKPTKKPNKKSLKAKACHSLATLRCGCQTLYSFEESLRTSPKVPFETKCDIRGKFFQCLDETSKPPCRHPKKLPKNYYRKHMEEIVRVLWSTRGCLLGPDDVARNSTVIKIDSGFCADLTPAAHAKDRRDPGKRRRKLKPKKVTP